ncbi:MAG TPA: hypothetical protein PLQ00_07635, partial [Thermoguttaceae bacterium]|nr:hypothetical protein [Thermoguttaceae bacterium]
MPEARGVLRGMAMVGVMGIWVGLGEGGLLAAWAIEPAASAQAEAVLASGMVAEQPAPESKEAEKADSPEKPHVSTPAVSPEELEKLVQQLDADSFSDRQAASQRLAELGRSAIDALIRAAASESLEANVRALDILKKHLDSQDAELKKSAKEALEKIAVGPRAPSARRAKDILKAYEEREKL